ncbi:MAG: acetyl-CoA carboxylase carboxyltransferase subunit alpha [Alphaproteobacteria bacterium]
MVLNILKRSGKPAIPAPYGFQASLLDFEQKLTADLQKELQELEELRNKKGKHTDVLESDIALVKEKISQNLKILYQNLTPWQKVQVARHAERPRFLDFAHHIFQDFMPLSGDRYYGEDCAIVGGLAFFNQRPLVLLGQERGKDTQSRIKHNFGMPKPEAYRKAIRLMHLADQYSLPVVSLVDTPGAFPGSEAEERGQAEAIAHNIDVSLALSVPFVSVIIGEGGSGGAMAIAAANHVLMLEYAVYSVISPEGCASILWRDAKKAEMAATAQKITADDMLAYKVIDKIIKEPVGGAHRNPDLTFTNTAKAIAESLELLIKMDKKQLIEKRREKYLAIGQWVG